MRFYLKDHHPLFYQALGKAISSSNSSNPCGSTSVPPGQQTTQVVPATRAVLQTH